MDDKILDRVKKLLRLSAGTNNPNEAAAAAAAAQKLITEHDLGVVTLDDASVQYAATRDASEPIAEENVVLPGGKLHAWEASLLSSVCRNHNARLLWVRNKMWVGGTDRSHGYTILGTEKDRATVVYLFHYLRRQVDEITIASCKGLGRTFANNFRLGMVDTIREALAAASRQSRTEVPQAAYARGGEHALMVVNESIAVLNAIERQVLTIQKARQGSHSLVHSFGSAQGNYSARLAGQVAGKSVHVTPGKALSAK